MAKKASQRHAVCSDPNYASQSGIIGVKLGAGLLGRAKISLSATYYLPLEHLLEKSEKYLLKLGLHSLKVNNAIYNANCATMPDVQLFLLINYFLKIFFTEFHKANAFHT